MLQIKKTGLLSVEHLVDTSMYLYVKYKKFKLIDRYFPLFCLMLVLKEEKTMSHLSNSSCVKNVLYFFFK